MEQYFRGDIYYVFPKEAVGCEQMNGRPAIIVSNDMGNEYSSVVEVVYLTKQDKAPLPTHVEINSSKYPSIALCEQISTISKERLGNYIASVTQIELKNIERAMLVSLDINSNLKGDKVLEQWSKAYEEWNAGPKKAVQMDIQKVEEIKPLSKGGLAVVEETPEYIRVCAERDIYKELYFNLMESYKRTA